MTGLVGLPRISPKMTGNVERGVKAAMRPKTIAVGHSVNIDTRKTKESWRKWDFYPRKNPVNRE